MKEIPILYSTAMIQAKLAGRKTQTRRTSGLVSLSKVNINDDPDRWKVTDQKVIDDKLYFFFNKREMVKCPYGQPGDLLWARETHIRTPGGKYHYKADISTDKDANRKGYIDVGEDWAKWKPSIHMPKGGARIWDRVVSIRVERLQDISEDDAIAEGLYRNNDPLKSWTYADRLGFGSAVHAYQNLWTEINGPGSWEANPWVWVVTTENLSLTGKPA